MSYAQKEEKGYLSLQGGVNTESSPLAAPEGTTSDELNMVIDITSMVRERRKGLAFTGSTKSYTGRVLDSLFWENAGLVVVFGVRPLASPSPYVILDVMFYNQDLSFSQEYEFWIYKSSITDVSASILRGRLVFTAGAAPFVFEEGEAGTLSAYLIRLYIRDFKLVDDGVEIGYRPTETIMTDEHKYNLYNAGWYEDQQLETAKGDPLDDFRNRTQTWPSNADIVYLGHITNSNGVTIFNGDELRTPLTGNSEAPRGHYIYNIRDINRESKLTNKASDGTVSNTLVALLVDGANGTIFSGNKLYEEVAGTGVPVDTSQPLPPPGEGGGGGIIRPPDGEDWWDEP